MSEKSFKLCLTMAGAVSAGAYTAGVIDELIQVLELWEHQQQKNLKLGKDHPEYDHSIPMHKVTLDVFSGASAGGITAALALQKILDSRYETRNKNTLLKDCWVTMADDDRKNTLEKLLESSDLYGLRTPDSLLNVSPIESLANTYFKPIASPVKPPWLSSNAELILTTTNLEGIDINIHFDQADQEGNGHRITQHSNVFRFKTQQNKPINPPDTSNKKTYYSLDPSSKKDTELLKNAVLATSAFPIGLPSREVSLPHKPFLKYSEEQQEGGQLHFEMHLTTEHQTFHTIDGGLLNNEPYGWGVKVLQEKCPEAFKENKFAVIMVDPLPGKTPEPTKTTKPGIFRVATAMFRALRNEVMLNQEGLTRAIAIKDRTRFLIAPSKGSSTALTATRNILASAPISGFAGFIDKKSRLHDYNLGRRNCRDFIRFHLTLPLELVPERLNFIPDQYITERFAVNPDKSNNITKKSHLPVIPDVRLYKARENSTLSNHPELKNYPELPVFNLATFKAQYQQLINLRLNALVRVVGKKWWVSLGFKLFIRRKLRNRIYRFIALEMATLTPTSPTVNEIKNKKNEAVL